MTEEVLGLKRIALLFNSRVTNGSLSIHPGRIVHGDLIAGQGVYENGTNFFQAQGACRFEITVDGANDELGAHATIISVETADMAFSFNSRDVSIEYPIYIREYGVIITDAQQSLGFETILDEIQSRQLQTHLQRIESEPEESFEDAAARTRAMICPTWLGLSRDVRIFSTHYRGIGNTDDERAWDSVEPRFHGQRARIAETNDMPVQFLYLLGRGMGCEQIVSRSLEEGCYPILHCRIQDDEVTYDNTAFVSYENSALTAQTLQGTPYLIADHHGVAYMFTEEQRAEFDRVLASQQADAEQTVYYSRTVATNTARVPRYAWFKNPYPAGIDYRFEGATGASIFSTGRVFAVAKLNGNVMPQEEVAVLLKPGETITYEFYIPHAPISAERAGRLIQADFDAKQQECLAFWKSKLEATTSISLPEPRIEQMMKAGFMHLDLVSYGLEPNGTVVPTIGVYTAIGSESSPIVQYMDAVGAHDLAERSLQFFLDKQHNDGFMQNFNGYMLETGAALWSIGEHYRYTRDEDWVSRIKPNLVKAYHYLMGWRDRNKRDDLVGKGFGMLEGKTADPEDLFRSYMLNGYAYVGLKRVAEMLASSDFALAEEIRRDADDLKTDILASFRRSMALSPVVPLGDGSWVPTSAPWADYRGPLSLYAEGGKWGTHGSMVTRDSLLGPLYLALQEVLEPDAPETSFLLHYHSELMCLHNVALSQPYYSIHPWLHLKRGERKAFLKSFYNGVAGLADRETFTFWEHYFQVSPHKTHEEAWFLMQCRWMLYMEEGDSLHLLRGVPRAWLSGGKRISIRHAATYFGRFSMGIETNPEQSRIVATIEFHSDRRPKQVGIHLPHPEGRRAVRASNGNYDFDREMVRVEITGERTEIVLDFA